MPVPIAGYILCAIAAYLLGSLPTGFLVGKARGVDIRAVGSGNIGATNVLRTLGIPAGVFVLLADGLKGWVAAGPVAGVICAWSYPDAGAQAREWFHIIGALCAVLGHNYTCWLRFKGGKGIATSAGVLAALVPYALLIILGVFLFVLAVSRYVSLASISASFALPFSTWATHRQTEEGWTLVGVTAAMAALAIYKHRSNIRRLLNGTENRLGLGKKTSEEGRKATR